MPTEAYDLIATLALTIAVITAPAWLSALCKVVGKLVSGIFSIFSR